MGNADKLIRLGLAVILVILWFQNIVTGTEGIILPNWQAFNNNSMK